MPAIDLLLTEGQQRLAARRRLIGLLLAPVFLGVALVLRPDNMTPEAGRLVAVIAAAIPLWMTEALPRAVTAVAAPALAVVVGVAPARELFAPFADPMVWVFIGGFFMMMAVERTRLDRKVAARLFPRGRATVSRLFLSLGLASAATSAVWSNSAATAMLTPAVTEVLARFGRRVQALALLGVAGSTAIGGLLTPLGAPPNLLAIAALAQYTDTDLSLLHWTLLGLPVSAALFAGWWGLIRWMLGADGAQEVHGNLRLSRGDRPPTTKALRIADTRTALWGLDRGQLAAAVVWALCGVAWLAPGMVSMIAGPRDEHYQALQSHLHPGVVALLGAALLFVLPAARKREGEVRAARPVLLWSEAAQIDWGVVLLFGGGLALGHQTVDTGLSQWIGDLAVRVIGPGSAWTLTWLMTAAALVATQVAHSTVTAALLCPLAAVTAVQMGGSPVAPCVATAMATSMAFALPAASDSHTIVSATGLVRPNETVVLGVVGAGLALCLVPPLAMAMAAALAG